MRGKLIVARTATVGALFGLMVLLAICGAPKDRTSGANSPAYHSCSSPDDAPAGGAAASPPKTVLLPSPDLYRGGLYVFDVASLDSQDGELFDFGSAIPVGTRRSIPLSDADVLVVKPLDWATKEDYRLWSDLEGLTGLSLPANSKLTGPMLSHFAAMCRLTYLEMESTPYFGGSDFSILGQILSLKHLSLSRRLDLTDHELSYLAPLRGLESLCFAAFNISSAHGTLLSFPNLARLRISSIRYPNTWIAIIPNLEELEDLTFLSNTNLTDSVFGMFKNLPRLKKLDIGPCGEVTNAGISLLAECTSLERLSLSHGSSTSFSAISELKFLPLKFLEVAYWRQLSAEDLHFFGELPLLERLSLLGSRAEWDGLAALASSPLLSELDLRGCKDLHPEDLKAFRYVDHSLRIRVGGESSAGDQQIYNEIMTANPLVQIVGR